MSQAVVITHMNDILYVIAARVCPHHVLSSLWELYLPLLLSSHSLACWPTRLLTQDPRIWTFNPQADATYSGRPVSLDLLATSDFVYAWQFLPDTHLVYIVIHFFKKYVYTQSVKVQSFTECSHSWSCVLSITQDRSAGLETFLAVTL